MSDEHDDAAAADREQATVDRDQATTDREQATTDRDQATTDRDQATFDREVSDLARRQSRADVAQLAVEVGLLGASVQSLHDLIITTLVKSEEAENRSHAAAAVNKGKASKKWLAAVGISLTVSLLATIVTAGLLLRRIDQDARRDAMTQYQNCLTRNQNQREADAYVRRIDAAAQRARDRGDMLAQEIAGLIVVDGQPLPDCKKLLH